jgi:hypothetical protein
MNKLLAYHLIATLPLLVILPLYIYKIIGLAPFAIAACLYAFVYRPYIDFKRLQEKGLVTKEEFRKSFGFIRFRFLHELLFEK